MKRQIIKSRRQRIKDGTYKIWDNVIFKWLLTVRNRNVAVFVSILKTKMKELIKNMRIKYCQVFNGWLDC